jgi:hypothetical protein
MSSARSIDLPGSTHLQPGSRLAGNLAGHFFAQAGSEVTGKLENVSTLSELLRKAVAGGANEAGAEQVG